MQHIKAIAGGSTAIPSGRSHNMIPSCSETCEAFSGLSQPNRMSIKNIRREHFYHGICSLFCHDTAIHPHQSIPPILVSSVFFASALSLINQMNTLSLSIHFHALSCFASWFTLMMQVRKLCPILHSTLTFCPSTQSAVICRPRLICEGAQTKMQPAPGEMSGASLHHTTETSSMTRNLAVGGVAFMGERSATWVESVPQRVVE